MFGAYPTFRVRQCRSVSLSDMECEIERTASGDSGLPSLTPPAMQKLERGDTSNHTNAGSSPMHADRIISHPGGEACNFPAGISGARCCVSVSADRWQEVPSRTESRGGALHVVRVRLGMIMPACFLSGKLQMHSRLFRLSSPTTSLHRKDIGNVVTPRKRRPYDA